MMASKAMLASWGWLSAQATHLGFSPLTELTYPLVTQGTITDGQTWTFTAYQLNTVDLTTNTPENVTCNNVMWMNNKDVKLYDDVDEASGKIVNFRPEVLAPLVKMYLREPKMRDYSLTPYLSDDKTVAKKAVLIVSWRTSCQDWVFRVDVESGGDERHSHYDG